MSERRSADRTRRRLVYPPPRQTVLAMNQGACSGLSWERGLPARYGSAAGLFLLILSSLMGFDEVAEEMG
jgi:hypothetical protein